MRSCAGSTRVLYLFFGEYQLSDVHENSFANSFALPYSDSSVGLSE